MSWTYLDQMKKIKCKLKITRAKEFNAKFDPGPRRLLQYLVIAETLGNTGHIKVIQSYIANSWNLEVSSAMTTASEELETYDTPNLWYALEIWSKSKEDVRTSVFAVFPQQ